MGEKALRPVGRGVRSRVFGLADMRVVGSRRVRGLASGLVCVTLALAGCAAAPEREVRLHVTAEGAFTVTYTQPSGSESSKWTVADSDATDDFDTSFRTADLGHVQFSAVIAQRNIGPQEIRCTVTIDGAVVRDLTGDDRFVDCSADIRDLLSPTPSS